MSRWASPSSLHVIFVSFSSCNFCRDDRSDHHITLYRCYSPVKSTTRLGYITDYHLLSSPIFTGRYGVYLGNFCSVLFIFYCFSIYFVIVTPLSCVFSPKPLFILTIESLSCGELTSITLPGSEDLTFVISRTIRSHWSLRALPVPITLCDYRDRMYAPITSFPRGT